MAVLTGYLSGLFSGWSESILRDWGGGRTGRRRATTASFLERVSWALFQWLFSLLPASWPLGREQSGLDLTAWGKGGSWTHNWLPCCPGVSLDPTSNCKARRPTSPAESPSCPFCSGCCRADLSGPLPYVSLPCSYCLGSVSGDVGRRRRGEESVTRELISLALSLWGPWGLPCP